MITRGKASLVHMPGLGGLLGDSRDKQEEFIQHRSLTGKQWSSRKSRSKIAKQSRKRNRK